MNRDTHPVKKGLYGLLVALSVLSVAAYALVIPLTAVLLVLRLFGVI